MVDRVYCRHTEAIVSTLIFPEYSKKELSSKQLNDDILKRVAHWMQQGHKPTTRQINGEQKPVRKLLHKWDKLVEKDSVLYYRSNDEGGEKLLFLTPECMKTMVLDQMHNLAGHQGNGRTLALVKQRCYWTGVNEDVKDWVQSCERCLVAKSPTPKVKPVICLLTSH